MNITESLSDLLEAKHYALSYQEYCENFPALVTEAKYTELTVSNIFLELHRTKGNV